MATDPERIHEPSGNKAAYAVGYGMPPIEHRFKKGESGNPNGRPSKLRQQAARVPLPMAKMCVEEAGRLISITENGERVKVPTNRFIARKALINSANSSVRDQIAILKMFQCFEQQVTDAKRAKVASALAVKEAYENERYRKLDIPRPEQVPHPDDIVIDVEAGEVIYNGPANATDKEDWDAAVAFAETAEIELHYLLQERSDAADPQNYDGPINDLMRQIAFVQRTYPSERERRVPGFNLHAWRKYQAKLQRAQRRKEKAVAQSRLPK